MTHTSMMTEAEYRPRPTDYHAFLLRLWCGGDGAGWRASLQAPGDAERRGFADLDDLMAYLRALCSPPDDTPGPPPVGPSP